MHVQGLRPENSSRTAGRGVLLQLQADEPACCGYTDAGSRHKTLESKSSFLLKAGAVAR